MLAVALGTPPAKVKLRKLRVAITLLQPRIPAVQNRKKLTVSKSRREHSIRWRCRKVARLVWLASPTSLVTPDSFRGPPRPNQRRSLRRSGPRNKSGVTVGIDDNNQPHSRTFGDTWVGTRQLPSVAARIGIWRWSRLQLAQTVSIASTSSGARVAFIDMSPSMTDIGTRRISITHLIGRLSTFPVSMNRPKQRRPTQGRNLLGLANDGGSRANVNDEHSFPLIKDFTTQSVKQTLPQSPRHQLVQLVMQRIVRRQELVALHHLVAAAEVGDVAARFLDEQNARRDVPAAEA